ncbi:YcfA family protein [Dehalogenimonas lykanthroporepellens BL-DC-9]|nr:YcfA family protein [Dehalogenimonas lykanthroporepellens BL-DC-9]
MPRLSPVSWKELVKRLGELGFAGPTSRGRHPVMKKDNLSLIIPNPHRRQISVDLLSRLLRQAGISHDEWLGS